MSSVQHGGEGHLSTSSRSGHHILSPVNSRLGAMNTNFGDLNSVTQTLILISRVARHRADAVSTLTYILSSALQCQLRGPEDTEGARVRHSVRRRVPSGLLNIFSGGCYQRLKRPQTLAKMTLHAPSPKLTLALAMIGTISSSIGTDTQQLVSKD